MSNKFVYDTKLSDFNNDIANLLHPILSDSVSLKSEFKKRKDKYDYVKVHSADKDSKLAENWELEKQFKSTVRLKRVKPISRHFEDRLWCLIYSMGYPILNGNYFNIIFKRHNNSEGKKQIDVFAKDDETVLIVECKTKEVRGKKSLTSAIHEIENLKGLMASSIKRYYNQETEPKIVWIIATGNIIWDEKDLGSGPIKGIHKQAII